LSWTAKNRRADLKSISFHRTTEKLFLGV